MIKQSVTSWLRAAALLGVVFSMAGCKKDEGDKSSLKAPKPYAETDAPDALRAALARAKPIFNKLGTSLGKRLKSELSMAGAAKALDVCHDEAQSITKAVEKESGISVGRTSHRLRNPGNAPPWWAEKTVAAAGGRASTQSATLFDLGKSVGILQPIGLQKVCLSCHGAKDQLHASVKKLLQKHYPKDTATGFSDGDLRGFFWAEVPKS